MTNEDNARKRLKDLEDNPKHKYSKEADEQTRNDDINDPKFNKDGEQDARWHKDANGNYTSPDFE